MDCPRQVQGSEGFRICKKTIEKIVILNILLIFASQNANIMPILMKTTLHLNKLGKCVEATLVKNSMGIYELEFDGYIIAFPFNCNCYCSVIEHLTVLFSFYENGITIIEKD